MAVLGLFDFFFFSVVVAACAGSSLLAPLPSALALPSLS